MSNETNEYNIEESTPESLDVRKGYDLTITPFLRGDLNIDGVNYDSSEEGRIDNSSELSVMELSNTLARKYPGSIIRVRVDVD